MRSDPDNKAYWDQKQYHQKIFINSTFGVVFGQHSFGTLFEPLIGAACTSIARDWTQNAHQTYKELGYPVVQCDTDGLIACAPAHVCEQVAEILRDRYGNRCNLVCEEEFGRAVVSVDKKRYLAVHTDGRLKVRFLKYKQHTEVAINLLISIATQLLFALPPVNPIMTDEEI
jgi:DNA polymerase elongation subunit (family B)